MKYFKYLTKSEYCDTSFDMAKQKNPLFSLKAQGSLGDAISMRHSRKVSSAIKKPIPTDMKSLAQLSWRHMYQKAVALWHALSAAEQWDWESSARRRHMTGFAWFMSQALKPNPGLYLPLQGGIMSGDIDMAKNRLLKLPLPSDSQEPLTLAYYTANIAPYLYNEYVRAYHSVNQLMANNVLTVVAFNSERWDSDNMHDNAVNNNRITAKTAGIYIIGVSAAFDTNIGGRRFILIRNNLGVIFDVRGWDTNQNGLTRMGLTTLGNLAVNDWVEVAVLQQSGIALNLLTGLAWTPEFWAARVGV